MAVMVRFCAACAKCWAVSAGGKCPVCEKERPSVDAVALIERLASQALDEEAERIAAEDSYG